VEGHYGDCVTKNTQGYSFECVIENSWAFAVHWSEDFSSLLLSLSLKSHKNFLGPTLIEFQDFNLFFSYDVKFRYCLIFELCRAIMSVDFLRALTAFSNFSAWLGVIPEGSFIQTFMKGNPTC